MEKLTMVMVGIVALALLWVGSMMARPKATQQLRCTVYSDSSERKILLLKANFDPGSPLKWVNVEKGPSQEIVVTCSAGHSCKKQRSWTNRSWTENGADWNNVAFALHVPFVPREDNTTYRLHLFYTDGEQAQLKCSWPTEVSKDPQRGATSPTLLLTFTIGLAIGLVVCIVIICVLAWILWKTRNTARHQVEGEAPGTSSAADPLLSGNISVEVGDTTLPGCTEEVTRQIEKPNHDDSVIANIKPISMEAVQGRITQHRNGSSSDFVSTNERGVAESQVSVSEAGMTVAGPTCAKTPTSVSVRRRINQTSSVTTKRAVSRKSVGSVTTCGYPGAPVLSSSDSHEADPEQLKYTPEPEKVQSWSCTMETASIGDDTSEPNGHQ